MNILSGMTSAQASGLWSGLLIILFGLISIRVTFVRGKNDDESQYDESYQIVLASRVFENAARYIPVSVGALILLYHLEIPSAAIHALGATLLAGRVTQAIGLGKPAKASIARAGMVLTFVAVFAGGGILVLNAFL